MKKTRMFLSAILAVIIALSLTTIAFASIESVDAKQIALTHAGLSESEVIGMKVKTDYDDGMKIFEIEFRKGNMEYEYEVNAANGKIISADKEYDDDYVVPTSAPSTTKPAQTVTYITTEQAKSIALAHAGITENEAIRLTVKIDTENGISVYEVDFDSGKYEYDYDINAVTGKIISADKEYDDDYRASASVTEAPQTAVNADVAPQDLSDTMIQEKINIFFEKLVALFIRIFS